jgi:hypothetical protein
MALEGKIKDFGITDILQLISMQKKTGVLTLTSSQDTVTVTFNEGTVMAAESFQKWKLHLLGEVLVQTELLKSEDLDRVLAIQKETGQKLGHIVVQQGMVRAEELSSIIQLQVRETVYRILEWKEGDYRFDQGPVTYDKENMVPIPCENMLMEAMQITDEWPIVRKVVSSLSFVYKQSDEKRKDRHAEEDLDSSIDRMFDDVTEEKSHEGSGNALLKDFPLSLEEERIYSLVDGNRSVQKLIYAGRIGEFGACKAIYNLLNAGLIEAVGEEQPVFVEEGVQKESGRERKILRNLTAYAIMLILVVSLIISSQRSYGGLLFNLTGNMAGRFESLKNLHAVKDMNCILVASHVYFLEAQSLPEGLEDLVQKGILEKKLSVDPWGKPYLFEAKERRVILSSAGRDRQEKTDDDLVREIAF